MPDEKSGNRRGSGPRRQGADTPADSGLPEVAAETRFFLAVYLSKIGSTRIYRVYLDRDALLFIFLTPAHAFLDFETARRVDPTNWMIRVAETIRKGAVAGTAAVLSAVGILGFALSKAAFKDSAKVLELVCVLLAAAAVAIPVMLFVVTISIRALTKRVAYLDSLTQDQICREVANHKWSFRATAATVSDVCLDPPEPAGAGRGGPGRMAAQLSFSHQPTGKWKMHLLKTIDTKTAVRAFRQILGEDGVSVNVRLKKT